MNSRFTVPGTFYLTSEFQPDCCNVLSRQRLSRRVRLRLVASTGLVLKYEYGYLDSHEYKQRGLHPSWFVFVRVLFNEACIWWEKWSLPYSKHVWMKALNSSICGTPFREDYRFSCNGIHLCRKRCTLQQINL